MIMRNMHIGIEEEMEKWGYDRGPRSGVAHRSWLFVPEILNINNLYI
jgi:hypothetical protein